MLRFHAKERSEERTFRWTQDASEVAVSGMNGSERTVSLLMSDGGRPAAATPPRVRVLFNGVQIGEATVGVGFQPYVFAIPAELAAAAAKDVLPATLRLGPPPGRPPTRSADRTLDNSASCSIP